jgi:pimeloyl-ACP methyl ester carboxylesterase/drug/metabolite transporter (DMT)-like permease
MQSASAAPPSAVERFAPGDWALLSGAATAWGASFLFIEIGLAHFSPGLVAFLRVLFGAATLATIPAARRGVDRADLPLIALLGLIWMTVPFLLFAIAQQRIDSSLAGMINASAPLFTALVAAIAARQLPARLQAGGLALGFVGVVAISLPSIEGGSGGLGVMLVLLATLLYGCAFNLTGPLQRRNGALPVIWRAQLFALAALAPAGALGAAGSSFAWSSLLAMVVLGTVGTGLAFVWFTTLVGRVGPTRGSLTTYFLPVVAVALGGVFLDESIRLAALLGTALVLAGAYLASRQGVRDGREPDRPAWLDPSQASVAGWVEPGRRSTEPRAEVVRAGGLEIAYERAGEGPPLVFVHGAAEDGRVWRPQIAALADEFTVVAWDEPGAGRSSDIRPDFGLDDYARCLAALIEALALGPAHVAGLSWGGTVVQELYRRRPELVATLILVDSYAGWKGSLPEEEVRARVEGARQMLASAGGEFDPTLPGLFAGDPPAEYVPLLEDIAAAVRPESLGTQLSVMAEADQRDLLPRIAVPTLLIWGELDARSPLGVARQFERAIPDTKLVVIPDAGHMSNLEQPERFNDAVREFCRAH